jgi:hypothetical protein
VTRRRAVRFRFNIETFEQPVDLPFKQRRTQACRADRPLITGRAAAAAPGTVPIALLDCLTVGGMNPRWGDTAAVPSFLWSTPSRSVRGRAPRMDTLAYLGRTKVGARVGMSGAVAPFSCGGQPGPQVLLCGARERAHHGPLGQKTRVRTKLFGMISHIFLHDQARLHFVDDSVVWRTEWYAAHHYAINKTFYVKDAFHVLQTPLLGGANMVQVKAGERIRRGWYKRKDGR